VFQVAVNTSISNINDFLDHIVASTNMRCLTPPIALDGDCGFLAANLYAKSAFGEDALVNVSIEKARNGKLTGNIRIRYAILHHIFPRHQRYFLTEVLAILKIPAAYDRKLTSLRQPHVTGSCNM